MIIQQLLNRIREFSCLSFCAQLLNFHETSIELIVCLLFEIAVGLEKRDEEIVFDNLFNCAVMNVNSRR